MHWEGPWKSMARHKSCALMCWWQVIMSVGQWLFNVSTPNSTLKKNTGQCTKEIHNDAWQCTYLTLHKNTPLHPCIDQNGPLMFLWDEKIRSEIARLVLMVAAMYRHVRCVYGLEVISRLLVPFEDGYQTGTIVTRLLECHLLMMCVCSSPMGS